MAFANNKLILTVGQISFQERYKGFDEVIEAMPELLRRFPRLKYMIVGDGDDRNRLERKSDVSGLIGEQGVFLPAKSREALLDGQLGRLVDPNVPEELVKAIADVLCNGSSRQRNNLIRCFDVAHFRSRVAEWLMERTTKDQSLGVTAQRPRSGET